MTFSSSMNEVMVTISVSGRSALIRPMAVMPSMFGIIRSISTTSGSRRRATATPSEPSEASPTTSMSGWRSRKTFRPVRTTEWSSTIRTRMMVGSDKGPPEGCVAGSRSPSASRVESIKARASTGLRRTGREAAMMAATSSLGRNVLRTKPSARSASAECSRPSVQLMMRTRTDGASERRRLMNARPPSTSGKRGSTITTSGDDESTRSRAVPAWPALPTTTTSRPIPRRPVRLSLTRSSASTTRTRSGAAAPGSGSCIRPWSRCGRAWRNGPMPRSPSAERRWSAYVIGRGSTDRAAGRAGRPAPTRPPRSPRPGRGPRWWSRPRAGCDR